MLPLYSGLMIADLANINAICTRQYSAAVGQNNIFRLRQQTRES
jgi:hypothetical protein